MILSQAAATAALNGLTTNLGTNSTCILYSGTAPAGPDTALSGNTALVTATISSWGTPTYSASASGMASTATFSAGSYAPAASGTATFGRLSTSVGTAEEQLTVGTSGTDIVIGNTSIQLGTNVSFTLTLIVPSQSV